MLRRSQTGTGNSNTKYTLSAFGLEDHIYDGGGNNLNNKYYYSLAGQLIGLNNGSPNFLFTDALGSVVSSITSTANNASVKGNQVYGPYGNNPYSKGTMGTTKGYTGQYNDSLTQLDYYGARYYDPLVGVFLSADSVQGNLAGMNPYNYVGSNPQTNTDPNGEMYAPAPGAQPQGTPPPTPPPSNTSSDNLFGSLIEGLEQAVQDVEQAIAQNTAEAADQFVRSLLNIPQGLIEDGGDPFCLPCFALTPLIHMLMHPTPLASGTLPTPIIVTHGGETFTVPTQLSGQSMNLPPQPAGGNGPQTQTGGGSSGNQPPNRPPTAPPPDQPGSTDGGDKRPGKPESNAGSGDTVTLYRAVGETEFSDILRFGDYGLSPNESGKYFSFTQEGAENFAGSSFNAGRNMAITSIDAPQSFLSRGFSFYDPGGGLESIHFEDSVLYDLYDAVGLPGIISVPWIPDIGGD